MRQLSGIAKVLGATLSLVVVITLAHGPACALDELKAVISGEVTAHFLGEKPQDAPLRFGVEKLRFTFKGDPKPYDFTPQGTLHFSDWQFDIFSPDGRHVLLLQDRFGPYNVVRTDQLKSYLRGKGKPDYVFGDPTMESPGAVKERARWASDSVIEYVAGCCGSREKRYFRME